MHFTYLLAINKLADLQRLKVLQTCYIQPKCMLILASTAFSIISIFRIKVVHAKNECDTNSVYGKYKIKATINNFKKF